MLATINGEQNKGYSHYPSFDQRVTARITAQPPTRNSAHQITLPLELNPL